MAPAGRHAAARLVAARDLRRRWRALTALGLIVGLAGAVALAALAGARRSDTAYDRLLEETNAADAVVFASTEGIFDPDYGPFSDLPYVEAAGTFSIPFFAEEGGLFVPTGDWLDRVDRPRVLEGRLPDRDDPDEVVLSKPAVEEVDPGVRVGDTYPITLFSAQDQESGASEPSGPRVELEVVGLTSSPFETSTIVSSGSFFGTPAFLEAYGDELFTFANLMVKLRDGAADVPQLQADANRILGQPVPVADLSESVKRVTNGTDLERTGLAAFGVAVAVAGTVIVGQALTRSVRAAAADVPTLSALGLTRADLVRSLLLPHGFVVLVAVATTLVGAVALSPRFPIGLARQVEPDPGVHADWLVLLPGAALLVVLLVVAAALTALRAARADEPGLERRSVVVRGLASLGAPVVARIGAGLALEPGRGRRSLPTRPATLGAVAGVVGVIAALTLAAGIGDALGHPERFGTNWDVEAQSFSDDLAPLEAVTSAMEADDDLESVAVVSQVNLELGGSVLPTFRIEPRRGSLDFTVFRGRPPERDREVVLGPAVAETEGIAIGDTVTLGDVPGFEVVGLGFVPQTPHSSFDQGGWVHPDAGSLFEGASSYTVGGVADGADPDAVVDALTTVGGEAVRVITPDPPADQVNLQGVRSLPTLFAGFTVLLAVGTLAHVAASALRRRRGELAVLRSIGFTPRQAGWSLSWQASTLAALGLVLGVPLGLALGRTAWRSVADATPMIYVAPTALLALVLAVPVAVLLANAVAAVPGLRAARLRPAEVLRSE